MFSAKNVRAVNIRALSVFCAVAFLTFGCQAQSKIANPPPNEQAIKTEVAAANQSSPTDNSKVKFSSVYTKLDSKTCQPVTKPESPEDEGPDICDGYKNYKVFINYHGAATRIYIGTEITKDVDSWDASILPAFTANNAGNGQIIEWRLADGEPFACIVRAEYDKSIIDPDEKGTANELVVKSLKGFAPIDVKIDAKTDKRANEEIRRRADSAYQKL